MNLVLVLGAHEHETREIYPHPLGHEMGLSSKGIVACNDIFPLALAVLTSRGAQRGGHTHQSPGVGSNGAATGYSVEYAQRSSGFFLLVDAAGGSCRHSWVRFVTSLCPQSSPPPLPAET